MKKILHGLIALSLLVIMVIPTAVATDINSASTYQKAVASGECGANVTWTLSVEGVLTISGTGAMKDFYAEDKVPWNGYQSSIQKVTVDDGVTSVSANAFRECSNLTDAILSDSVETIGSCAFYNCEDLNNIRLGKSLNEIGQSAFQKCIKLKEITIPSGVSKLESNAFSGCKRLSNIILPAEINTISDGLFYECESLKSIAIPDGVVSIGRNAFYECKALTDVSMPESLESIGDQAFEYSKNLKEITIPKNVKKIGVWAFVDCDSLTNIEVDRENVAYQSQDGVLFDKPGITLISYPASNAAKTYRMPNTVRKLSSYAFYWSKNLESIQLSDNLTSIGEEAFHVIPKLTRITIPKGVESIGTDAFGWNENLKMIRFLGDAPDIGNLCFSGDTLTVYYPKDNDTWTQEIMQQYNGKNITWKKWSISNVFSDVRDSDWFAPYVEHTFEKNLMNGTGNGKFEPYMHLSRAMAVQILYARAGKPAVSDSPKFNDVRSGDWYFNAVQWASENGIVKGVGNGKFAPNDDVTREQLAVILHASQGRPASANSLSRFVDSNHVSVWAQDAVEWAVNQDIIRGSKKQGNLYINPQDGATRAEAATMLTQYDRKF